MPMSRVVAVTNALQRYSGRNATVKIERAAFLQEELSRMVAETVSMGQTPEQTVSRVLQELRDSGVLFFSETGVYVLNAAPINASLEDLPDDALENAIDNENLALLDVETSNIQGLARQRRGMTLLRKKTLLNYRCTCALCDVNDAGLLVASHISRWADHVSARGLLSNVICFCTFHDKLFENGYFAMDDGLNVIWRKNIAIKAIRTWRDHCTTEFKHPSLRQPSIEFIKDHRSRVKL